MWQKRNTKKTSCEDLNSLFVCLKVPFVTHFHNPTFKVILQSKPVYFVFSTHPLRPEGWLLSWDSLLFAAGKKEYLHQTLLQHDPLLCFPWIILWNDLQRVIEVTLGRFGCINQSELHCKDIKDDQERYIQAESTVTMTGWFDKKGILTRCVNCLVENCSELSR